MRRKLGLIIISVLFILTGSANAQLINGSFEMGLIGWTANDVSVDASYPATDGTNAAHLGVSDVSGSTLFQTFSITPGSTNQLTFDIAAGGDPGRIGIIRVRIFSTATNLVSQMFTNNARNTLPFPYESKMMAFVVPAGVSNVTLTFEDFSPSNGVAVDPTLDSVKIFEAAPKVIVQPKNQNAAVGDSTSFSVTATGAEPLKYQWQFNGTNLGGLMASSFTLFNVQTSQAGNYSVVITNSHGAVTSLSAALTFSAPVAITTQPQGQIVPAGTNVFFNVATTGEVPLFYQWNKNGAKFIGATNSTLSISNVALADAGNYSVLVSNSVSFAISSNAPLSIVTAPIISSQPQGRVVAAGSTVTFVVGVTGESPPLPSVASGNLRLWFKADAGVITNSPDKVSQWLDQSGRNNHAAQTDSLKQPSLIPGAVNNRAALRFDGIQNSTTGDFLQGLGDVGLTDGFTSFLVYSRANRNISEQIPSLIGTPSSSVRAYYIRDQEMAFSGWGNDYGSGFIIPAATFRIWTQRMNVGKTLLEFFDTDGTNNFTATRNISGFSTPQPGYFIGGLGSQTRNFQGDIAEAIYYQGTLSEPDRLSVQNYLDEKYFQPPASIGYQWRFEGASLPGQTNFSLTLTNVQASNAGNYSVVVSNAAGFAVSSNALLTVLNPIVILTHPQGGKVVVGTNFTFSVSVSGDAPVYQWQKNGVPIGGATNSSLNLTNIQLTNAGTYSVSISNLVSAVVSSNAILSVVAFPIITTQPRGQSVLAGADVTFFVGVNEVLPPVSSSALRLWLKADSGIVIDASGRVSQWQDQSARTNHASQANTNRQPKLVASGFNGRPIVRFDGLQEAANGDFLFGSGDVGLTAGFTSFLVYSRTNRPGIEEIPTLVGLPGTAGASRAFSITNNEMRFSTWVTHYGSGFSVPPSTVRIGTERLNASRTLIEFFDTNGTNDFTSFKPTSGTLTPGSGYYVGGLSSLLRHFQGDIAEIIYYQGTLTETERQSVDAYLRAKYFLTAAGDGASAYQWRFNGEEIPGATNSFLTLKNVQTTNSGNYSVVVSNLAGINPSSNAFLTVNVPPFITTQPQSHHADAGSTTMLDVVAGGTAPLHYQWQKNASPLTGETNAFLLLDDLAPSDAGIYHVVVTSPYGIAISSNAVLSIDVSTLKILNVDTFAATDFILPIQLEALGSENALSFSLSFDPSILQFESAALVPGLAGPSLILTTNRLGAGKLGIFVGLSGYETFQDGTQRVVNVGFKVAPVTNSLVTAITFGDDPTYREISDVFVDTLWSAFSPGMVSISAVDFEGDASPRGTGNRILSATDWIQVGRFAAGLESVTNASEFQRADSAPRSTFGDGSITLIDWVQAGRYAFGADAISPASGPSVAGGSPTPLLSSNENRSMTLQTTQTGQTNVISVRLVAQGDENGVALSVTYNPAALRFQSANLGAGAVGALLNVNTNQAGKVGLALVLPTGNRFSSGAKDLVKLSFAATGSAAGSTVLSFADAPVLREISDAFANPLPVSYSADLTLEISLPTLSILKNEAQITLSWPASSSGFTLQGTTTLGTNWVDITTDLTTNGPSVRATLPISEQQQFFRLRQP